MAMTKLPTGVMKPCAHCGKERYFAPSNAHRLYCSTDCYWAARWGSDRQEDRTCPVCSTVFRVQLSKTQVCCSIECRRQHYSNIRRGEQSHFWRGGKTAPYHTDWKSVRREALDRDHHQCVLCGGNDRLQVHHKNPYRYSQSHALDNLVTLCRSCHSREEWKVNPLVAQVMADGRLGRIQSIK